MIGFITFCLTLCLTDLTGKAVRITSNLVDLSAVLSKYHKFVDIFNKAKAEILAPHHSYDLQIKLENREKPSIRTIYSLSTVKQEMLKEFIWENLNMGFI